MGYDSIEAEAGGAARRIYPNTIRDNRRRDGREGEEIVRAKRDKNTPGRRERAAKRLIRLCREPTEGGERTAKR